MIWHIVKKDLRLLWPYIAAVACLRFVQAGLVLKLGIFAEPRALQMATALFGLVCSVAASLVIVIAVHQDPLVGTRQDVLTRPVARRDLLLAKLLFVLIAIEGPIFLAGLTVALAHDLSFGGALAAALTNAAWGMEGTLPVVMVAALTGTLLEAIIGLFALALCAYAPLLLNSLTERSLLFSSLSTLWVAAALQTLIVVIGAAVILPLQYRERWTGPLRAALAAVMLATVAVSQLPWTAAFALTQATSPNPALADRFRVAFAPDLGKFVAPREDSGPNDPDFYLPLRVSGLPEDAILQTERTTVTLIDAGGHVLYRGSPALYNFFHRTNLDGDSGLQLRLAKSDAGTMSLHQSYAIPRPLFDRIKQQRLRVRVDYSFALLQRGATVVLPATGGQRIIPDIGSCAWRLGDGPYPNVGKIFCYPTAERKSCFVQFIRNRTNGARNPDEDFCFSGYEPRFLAMTPLNEPGQELVQYAFRDDDNRWPERIEVRMAQAAEADVVLTPYAPQAFFTRRVETPPLRLADWGVTVVPNWKPRLLR